MCQHHATGTGHEVSRPPKCLGHYGQKNLEGDLMKHDFQVDKELRLIFCTLEGELDIEEAARLSKRLREKADKLGFNVLYDACKLEEPKSAMPVHDLTAKLSSILESIVHRKNVMVAFLYESGNYDAFWQFYEDAAVDRGLMIRIFIDKEEAIEWLSN
jgi:hypothetical protein